MGSRSKGGYKLPENNTGHHWLGKPVKTLVTGKRHRRYRPHKEKKYAHTHKPRLSSR